MQTSKYGRYNPETLQMSWISPIPKSILELKVGTKKTLELSLTNFETLAFFPLQSQCNLDNNGMFTALMRSLSVISLSNETINCFPF